MSENKLSNEASALTLRDQFAIAALTALLPLATQRDIAGKTPDEFRKQTCDGAYAMADAMIEARKHQSPTV